MKRFFLILAILVSAAAANLSAQNNFAVNNPDNAFKSISVEQSNYCIPYPGLKL